MFPTLSLLFLMRGLLFLEGAFVVVGASVVASLVGFMVVTDAIIEGPDAVELVASVEATLAKAVLVDISCDDVDRVHVEVDRVHVEDGVSDSVGINEVFCPDTPVKV